MHATTQVDDTPSRQSGDSRPAPEPAGGASRSNPRSRELEVLADKYGPGYGTQCHRVRPQPQIALTRLASRTARSWPACSAGSISAADNKCTLPGSAAIRSVLVPAA